MVIQCYLLQCWQIFNSFLRFCYPSRQKDILKELRNHKWKYFCVRHISRQKQSQHFKLLFFTTNLHFLTSKQISTYRKPHLPPTSRIYLVFLPLEMQGRLKHTKVYHTLFNFVWKKTTNKPLKVAAAKTYFSSLHVIGTTCFVESFYSMW